MQNPHPPLTCEQAMLGPRTVHVTLVRRAVSTFSFAFYALFSSNMSLDVIDIVLLNLHRRLNPLKSILRTDVLILSTYTYIT